jgi:type IV pilus assembly protein PilO
MAELLDRISKLTLAQKAGVAAGIYVLLLLALFFGLISPVRQSISDGRAQNVKLKAERDDLREDAENREAFEREVDRLNDALVKALKQLPNDREIPDLLRRISSIGKKIGLEFILFQPLPEVPRDYFADVPVKVRMEGSYHEVAVFFDRIGKLTRIVNVRDISMGSPQERSGRIVLTTDGTVVTYRFLSADEEKKKAKTDGAKKKAKAAASEGE